jgi:PPOX class probable F420-dependent enzyme
MIDFTTEFGRRVASRLEQDWIIWLTTVGSDLTPQPRPVWFLWDGQSFLIYSRPNAAKLQHIAQRPRVSLNLDGDKKGGDIVVFTGDAYIDPAAPPVDQVPDYVAKYEEGFARLQRTATEFAQGYAVAIRVLSLSLRGH